MPVPLYANESKLNMHFKQSSKILVSAVDSSAQLQVGTNFLESGVIGGLYGSGCELIPRNRGRRVPVAPLVCLGHGLWVWLGYHEEWEGERSDHGTPKYSFKTVGLSIHFGFRNNVLKPQIFRAEWAGWARWGSRNYSFQAGGAAHPHWHFDALDSVAEEKSSQRATELIRRLKANGDSEIREFSPNLPDLDVRDFIGAQKLSRIHLASAAAWWKSPPHGEHMHGPASLGDIETWVLRSIEYIKGELARL